MAEETKAKNRISVFERLNAKYGREEVNKRLGEVEGVAAGGFYKFENSEKILIKKHPDAVYSPNSFKFSDDGWGYVGNLQKWDQVKTSKETGEAALIYPFGLNEQQMWELLGNIRGIFPKWSIDVDGTIEILDGLLVDINISQFDFTLPDGTVQKRKKIRLSIAKDGDGYEAYKKRVEWLNNRVASLGGETITNEPGNGSSGAGAEAADLKFN